MYKCIYVYIYAYIHIYIANKKPFVYDYREAKMPNVYRVLSAQEPYD